MNEKQVLDSALLWIKELIRSRTMLIITYYYIDTSVLLENVPLVKFIKTTPGTRVIYFP